MQAAVEVDAEQVADAPVVVVVQALVAAAAVVDVQAAVGGLLVLARLAAYMIDKCGSTTAYIVLHNSMDYYMLDIGSFKFLLPLRDYPLRAIGKRCTDIYICYLKIKISLYSTGIIALDAQSQKIRSP